MLYSKSTGGFYDPAINAVIPTDAVTITDEHHQALLSGQAMGQVISSDANGQPILTDVPEQTTEQLAAAARLHRDELIAETDYLVMPDYPIDATKLAAVKTYRQALRDISLQVGFPSKITWPDSPLGT